MIKNDNKQILSKLISTFHSATKRNENSPIPPQESIQLGKTDLTWAFCSQIGHMPGGRHCISASAAENLTLAGTTCWSTLSWNVAASVTFPARSVRCVSRRKPVWSATCYTSTTTTCGLTSESIKGRGRLRHGNVIPRVKIYFDW